MPLERFLPRLVRTCRRQSLPVRCLGAGLVTASMFASRVVLLEPVLPQGLPFLLLFLGTLLSACLFGRGGGLFATAFGAGLVLWFFGDPIGSLWVRDAKQGVAIGLFVLIAGLIAWVVGELQAAVEQLKAAEGHKGLLLREFRHRSRNDLANLTAMLRLRLRRATNDDTRAALLAACEHAQALARVHTLLASASPGHENEAVVDSREFVCGLTAELQRALAGQGLRPVAVVAEAVSQPLNTERAVTLGLVLNELVTNAMKYAFPGEDGIGRVEVGFVEQGGHYVLTVTDDGVGLAVPADSGGLGTRLLRGLAAQLRGTLERGPGPGGAGVQAVLRFPVATPSILPMPQG